VAQAPKQGFTFPLELWMRQDFESAFEAVASHGELGKLIDLPALRRLWRQYQQGRVHWRTVWVPFALGRWLMART
jgi:hypothetical protein